MSWAWPSEVSSFYHQMGHMASPTVEPVRGKRESRRFTHPHIDWTIGRGEDMFLANNWQKNWAEDINKKVSSNERKKTKQGRGRVGGRESEGENGGETPPFMCLCGQRQYRRFLTWEDWKPGAGECSLFLRGFLYCLICYVDSLKISVSEKLIEFLF